MRGDTNKIQTGLNVFLALSKLELILEFGERATPLPDDAARAAVELYDLAYVSDFRSSAATELCSELFTVKAVGELMVKMGVEQGIILADAAQGLGVRLHAELSPVYSQMLASFNRCLGVVLRFLAVAVAPGAHVAHQLPSPASSSGLRVA